MLTAEKKEIIPASAEDGFALIHDYKKRLEWDTLLSEARLEPEFSEAMRDAISVCRGRLILSGFALQTPNTFHLNRARSRRSNCSINRRFSRRLPPAFGTERLTRIFGGNLQIEFHRQIAHPASAGARCPGLRNAQTAESVGKKFFQPPIVL